MAHLFRGSGQPDQATRETRLLPETLWAHEPMPTGIPPGNTVVITISRQFGSGGSDIARLVAKKAGLHYVDHQIIDEVASRLGIDAREAARQDEQTAGSARPLLEAIQASSPLRVSYSTLVNPTQAITRAQQETAYLHLTQRVLLEAASRGNAVIVGRGSQFLLHNVQHTLHIYVFAPMPYRIEHIMGSRNINRAQAKRLIEWRDHEQASYLRHNYGTDGHQPGLYHLLINTSLFTYDLAADLIIQGLPVIRGIGEPS